MNLRSTYDPGPQNRLSWPTWTQAVQHAGSEAIELAKGLLSDRQTHVVYQPASNELRNLRELLRLTEREVAAVGSLSPGRRCGRWDSAASWSSTWCRGRSGGSWIRSQEQERGPA